MKIVIRADASIPIGTGHIMRCLALAEALRERGAEVVFVCRELSGNGCDLIVKQSFLLFKLSYDGEFDPVHDAEQTTMVIDSKPDWLVADHYGIDVKWERCLRPQVGRIMVIDDLADRRHDCDMLLDQNLFDEMLGRYDGLTPSGCRLFLGPRYALLRDEFIVARRTLRKRDGIVRRIMLFFGGSDPTNETEKALLAIKELNCGDIHVDVVVGAANPKGDMIRRICADMPNVTFHRQVVNMAELMANADLAIGAGGTATWERCLLGLPTLIVVVADNQAKPAQAAHNAGLVNYAGTSDMITPNVLAKAIRDTIRQPSALIEMSDRCLSFMGARSTPIPDDILSCLYEGSNET